MLKLWHYLIVIILTILFVSGLRTWAENKDEFTKKVVNVILIILVIFVCVFIVLDISRGVLW
jgi:hypothetical protein